MFKKYLTMFLAVGMITAGVVSDRAIAIEQKETYGQTIEKCKKSYLDFKRTGEPSLIKMYSEGYDEESRKGFAIICLTYAVGYEDGINGRT